MSKSPKKPDATPVSEGEKIQAQLAKDQIAYYRGTYAPLEGQYADEAGKDYTSRLSAQTRSAGMREATTGMQQLALSGAPVDTAAIGSSLSAATDAAASQGRQVRDKGRLNALGVGLGVTADAGQSLSSASQMQTGAAIDRVREQMTKQQAAASVRAAAVGGAASAIGAVATYGALSSSGQSGEAQSTKKGASQAGYSDRYLSNWSGAKS